MNDLSQTCLMDIHPNSTEADLAVLHCSICNNADCSRSRINDGKNLWEIRMTHQLDRLILNPARADEDDPEYTAVRNQDFTDRNKARTFVIPTEKTSVAPPVKTTPIQKQDCVLTVGDAGPAKKPLETSKPYQPHILPKGVVIRLPGKK